MARHITPNGRGLGWRPELPDHRDFLFAARPATLVKALPDIIDLEPNMPPVYDQQDIGSCTGNAIAGAIQYDRTAQGLPHAERVPSRLMIYYGERQIEGTINSDAGAEIRDGVKFVSSVGTCFEDGPDGWAYDPRKFTQAPPQACYDAAIQDRAIQYRTIVNPDQQLRAALAEGFPVVFGFTCYPELDSDAVAKTGILPMPASSAAPIGGHAVLLVGYNNTIRLYKVRNSWGAGWGDKGYFYMPFEYLVRSDLASDFWVINHVG